MADPVVFSNAAIWYGGYDITPDLNECNLMAKRAENPDSRFGDDIEAFFPSIQSVDLNVKGFRNCAVDGSETVIAASRLIAAAPDRSAWPITLAPPFAPNATPAADGNIAYNLRGSQTAYRLAASHGDSLKFELASRVRSANGALDRLTVVLPKATYAVTTTGVGRQLGALSATQKMVAVLHVFAVTGGTWTLTVESDDNSGFTTPIVRATFTGATTITRQSIEIAGAVTDDWWRVVLTKAAGTSAVAAALLGINNL